MKFGQVIEHNKRKFFLQKKKKAKNEAGRLIQDLILFFKKALYEVKASVLELSFKIFR